MNINDILETGATTVGITNVDTNVRKNVEVARIAQDFYFESLAQDADSVNCFLYTGYTLVYQNGRYTSFASGQTNPVAPLVPSTSVVNESSISLLKDVYGVNAEPS